jgi:hypothetical protein
MYQYLLKQGTPFTNKFIWNLRIPLKIKFFLWYLQRGVILTKDNLAKRNWVGSQKCCFCDCNETILHLFFDCQHAKTIRRAVRVATGLTPLRSVIHMLKHWLTGIQNKDKNLIFVGVVDVMWAIWCTHNDLIFRTNNFVLLYRLFWSLLQHEDTREIIRSASKALEVVALDIFAKNRWSSNNRLCF